MLEACMQQVKFMHGHSVCKVRSDDYLVSDEAGVHGWLSNYRQPLVNAP
jgi:hypothetical protein